VGPTVTNFSEEISATHLALSDARQHVGAWLRDNGQHSQTLIGDVEMVVTELGANVIDHTSSPWIRVAVALPGERVTVEIANQGAVDAVPPVESWGQLLEGTRGRGLRIIRALCAEVAVFGDEKSTHIRCDITSGGDF